MPRHAKRILFIEVSIETLFDPVVILFGIDGKRGDDDLIIPVGRLILPASHRAVSAVEQVLLACGFNLKPVRPETSLLVPGLLHLALRCGPGNS